MVASNKELNYKMASIWPEDRLGTGLGKSNSQVKSFKDGLVGGPYSKNALSKKALEWETI